MQIRSFLLPYYTNKGMWTFYILSHFSGATYAGVSPDPHRRLRQHNGEIKGGAKYTTSKGGGWKHVCFVNGFRNKQEVLQFEWAVKHHPPRSRGGLQIRIQKLIAILNKIQWTSNAPPACDVPLRIDILDNDISLAPSQLPNYVSITPLPFVATNDHYTH